MAKDRYDIVILGGGASGLAAAVTAKRAAEDASVLIIEKNDTLGRKILSTGNGRCNLSNTGCREHDAVLSFFESVGIATMTDEEGRIYPYTEDAKDVVAALTDAVERSGAEILLSKEVTHARFADKEGEYEVSFKERGTDSDPEKVRAGALIISMGGKAAPRLGTTGDGYRIAKDLYHTVTKLAPALTAVETREDMSPFKGIRAKAKVSLIAGGGTIFEERGEVQFTEYGISGIAVFDMSRYMTVPEGRTRINGFDDYSIEIDFLPDTIDARKLVETRMSEHPEAPLRSIVRSKIAAHILEKTGGDAEMTAWVLKHFTLHPKDLKGWDFAEITKGGVPLTEINTGSMASKFMPGLFFAGEIIDFDGPCGGYNLENAWETGMRAGRSAAESLGE